MDTFSKKKRSEIMSRIRGSNTRPEKIVKAALWAAGFRYSRTSIGLEGKPDIVLPKYRMAVFVHGCFWHGHSCPRGKLPSSNLRFWQEKIGTNIRRDARVLRRLRTQGWHCFQIWQCRLRDDVDRVLSRLEKLRDASHSVRKTN